MKDVVSNPDLVAYCGLYCGACGSYLKERCPGCHDNTRAKWCRIKVCCEENEYLTCADCKEYENPADCGKFNNLLAKLFACIFHSNRTACIEQIKELGIQDHADKMTELKQQTVKR